ncbi:hypothetical protein Ddc_16320 [Ditylenchus destructor]|nr:hypothetical protein Ddc_16320 [Ditylenchus destructor]
MFYTYCLSAFVAAAFPLLLSPILPQSFFCFNAHISLHTVLALHMTGAYEWSTYSISHGLAQQIHNNCFFHRSVTSTTKKTKVPQELWKEEGASAEKPAENATDSPAKAAETKESSESAKGASKGVKKKK